MHCLVGRFVEEDAAWLEGLYVQIRVPFFQGAAERIFFQSFETEHPFYSHQGHERYIEVKNTLSPASTSFVTDKERKVLGSLGAKSCPCRVVVGNDVTACVSCRM